MGISLVKQNLFIIDDSRMSQMVLGAYVNNYFIYNVFHFDSVEHCLKNAEVDPRIILLDYMLPGMNGDEAIPVLKEKWPRVQIIIVSGQREYSVASGLLKKDIVDYVKKSADTENEIITGIEQAERILKIQGI